MKTFNIIHSGNLACFLEVYRDELYKAHEANPDKYAWPITEFETVFKRMATAIEHGSFSKDSDGIKATCKVLKIKRTYKAIKLFIST